MWKGEFWQNGKSYPMKFQSFKAKPVAGGSISGSGTDDVGEFKFQGSFNGDASKVRFVKQYKGAHSIFYEGNVNLSPPRIQGHWGWSQGKHEDKFVLSYN